MRILRNIIPQFRKNKLPLQDITLPNDIENFLIISHPRTGSNLLCGILNSHPDIISFHELFHPRGIFYGPTNHGKFNLGTLEERNRNPGIFLSKIYNKSLGAKAIGFKMFQKHNDDVLNYLLGNAQIKKIILQRNNLLASYVSARMAKQTGEYQNVGNSGTRGNIKVHVDPDAFLKYVNDKTSFINETENVLKNSGQIYFKIEYSEMIQNLQDQLIGLLKFLGVNNSIPLEQGHRKQSTGELPSRISNFQEISNKLSGTNYEIFLKNEGL